MKTIVLIIIFASSLFPQSINLRILKITDVDGDARNPFIAPNPYLEFQPNIFFEIHSGNTSNIASINYYDFRNKKFSTPVYLTNNSHLNINPRCIQFPTHSDYDDFLFFQTNENGNWEIAYKTRKDSIWSDTKFVNGSSENETNPSLLFRRLYYQDDSIRILYQKGHSIYLATFKDSSFYNEEVFNGTDSANYSQPTGLLYAYFTASHNTILFIDVAAVKEEAGKSVIVYKTKNDSTGKWSEEKIVDDSSECNNPKFLDINYSISLSYEKKSGDHTNIYFIRDWGSNTYSQRLMDSIDGDLSNLQTWNIYLIIDYFKRANQDNIINNLYAYRYLTNDSLYICTNASPKIYFNINGKPDTLIYTKVKNTGLAVSYISTDSGSVNVVWEDSANGKIQLFGIGPSVIAEVKNYQNPVNFHLYQNYPNPFNPSTTIKYQIPKESLVTIKIFDVLGREVATLLNAEQKAGEYEIEWNASGFASGVYICRLKANPLEDKTKIYVKSSKLVLLK